MSSFGRGLGEGIGQGIGLLLVALLVLIVIVLLTYWAVHSGWIQDAISGTIKKSVGLG
jgi:Tfp pilus assembly protein PilX